MSSPVHVEPMSHGQFSSPGGHSPVVASVDVLVSGSAVVTASVVSVALPFVVVAVVDIVVLAVTDVPIVVMPVSLPDDPDDELPSVSAIIPSGWAQAIEHTTRAKQSRLIRARYHG
jgi:hypothetical protein